jgi:hypothetical protein
MTWSKRQFLGVLKTAHIAERQFVEGLRGSGAACAHGQKLVLPDHNPRKDFCPTPDAVALVQLEIKCRSLAFTSPSDFPYPTVFLDDEQGLSRGPSPFAWVLISKPTGAWVWVSALDRDERWEFKTVWDSMRGFNIRALVAPSEVLRSAESLLPLLYRGDALQYVEGEMGAFTGGEKSVDKCDPTPRGRVRKATKKQN